VVALTTGLVVVVVVEDQSFHSEGRAKAEPARAAKITVFILILGVGSCGTSD
jgi:hypothetical protein